MSGVSRVLCFTIILVIFWLNIIECRYKSHKFYTDVFFSYYHCKGSFDHGKIKMLALLCLQCYDGDWGAYRYRNYCSRDCFQSFTYMECLQKLKHSEASWDMIQRDFEFITNNKNFLKPLTTQITSTRKIVSTEKRKLPMILPIITTNKTMKLDNSRATLTNKKLLNAAHNHIVSKILTAERYQNLDQRKKKFRLYSLIGSG